MTKEDEVETSVFSDHHNSFRQDTSFCSRLHSSTPNLNPSSGVAIFTRYPGMEIGQESRFIPPTAYLNTSSVLNTTDPLNSNLT